MMTMMTETTNSPNRPRSHRSRAAAAVLFMAALTACASSGRGVAPSLPTNRVEVEVRNGNRNDFRLYVVRAGGYPSRIGYVHSGERARFRIPALVTGTGEYELMARFLGSRETLRSGLIPVDYDARAIWTVRTQVRTSSVFLRRTT